MDKVLKISELCEALQISAITLKRRWRRLPHFLVGNGTDLRSARFRLDKVSKEMIVVEDRSNNRRDVMAKNYMRITDKDTE